MIGGRFVLIPPVNCCKVLEWHCLFYCPTLPYYCFSFFSHSQASLLPPIAEVTSSKHWNMSLKNAFSYLGRLLKMCLPEPGFRLENNFSVFELLLFIALTITDRSCGHSLRHAGLLGFKKLIGAVLTTRMYHKSYACCCSELKAVSWQTEHGRGDSDSRGGCCSHSLAAVPFQDCF